MSRPNAVKAALLVLLGTTVTAKYAEEDPKGGNTSSRHDVEKKNLRITLSDGKLDVNDEDTIDNKKFEEDEKLWERILQQDLSITPFPTLPPITPTLPPNIPIILEDEECELMVRTHIWHDYFCIFRVLINIFKLFVGKC